MSIRQPAVAGQFYPADKEKLEYMIDSFLDRTKPVDLPGKLKGLIVPHAGYIFSGPIAAVGFKQLQSQNIKEAVVVLAGTSHQTFFEGLVFPEYKTFETPLGRVEVEELARKILQGKKGVVISDIPHKFEHSLEVELPFLQKTVSSFTIVPLLFGEGDYQQAAEILTLLFNELPHSKPVYLIVSADLSHYETYLAAKEIDSQTSRAINSLKPEEIPPEGTCGIKAIQAVLVLAQKAGWKIRLLDCRNSGDITGDKLQVVGYGAFAIYDPEIKK